jgi:hypothetical protein
MVKCLSRWSLDRERERNACSRYFGVAAPEESAKHLVDLVVLACYYTSLMIGQTHDALFPFGLTDYHSSRSRVEIFQGLASKTTFAHAEPFSFSLSIFITVNPQPNETTLSLTIFLRLLQDT